MMDEIPERLRRDKDNKAPFMELTPWQQKRRDQNSDEWQPDAPPLVIGLDGQMSVEGQKVVGMVIDDAWLAPWTSEPNPSDNLQATNQAALLPWASKS